MKLVLDNIVAEPLPTIIIHICMSTLDISEFSKVLTTLLATSSKNEKLEALPQSNNIYRGTVLRGC